MATSDRPFGEAEDVDIFQGREILLRAYRGERTSLIEADHVSKLLGELQLRRRGAAPPSPSPLEVAARAVVEAWVDSGRFFDGNTEFHVALAALEVAARG